MFILGAFKEMPVLICSPVSSSRMDPANLIVVPIGLTLLGSVCSIASWAPLVWWCRVVVFLVWWEMQHLLLLWVTPQLLILWLMQQSSLCVWGRMFRHALLVSVSVAVGLPSNFHPPLVVCGCWGCSCFISPPRSPLCLLLFCEAFWLVTWVVWFLFPLCFFLLRSPFRTYAKLVAAATIISALFLVDIVMYLCLKNTVSAIHTFLMSLTHTS